MRCPHHPRLTRRLVIAHKLHHAAATLGDPRAPYHAKIFRQQRNRDARLYRIRQPFGVKIIFHAIVAMAHPLLLLPPPHPPPPPVHLPLPLPPQPPHHPSPPRHSSYHLRSHVVTPHLIPPPVPHTPTREVSSFLAAAF